MSSNSKLPVFQSGDSLANQLTQSRLTKLVEYIRENTPVAGVGVRVTRTTSGSLIESTRPRMPSGSFSPGYILGSTNYGSSTAGPGGVTGPWGGSADTQSGDPRNAYTDTWDADRAPRNTSNVDTNGVKLTLLRSSPTGGSTRIFMRSPEVDSAGRIVHIPGEVLLMEVVVL